MILKDGKQTTWIDDLECLVRAAYEAAFSKRDISVVHSERYDVSIRLTNEGWMTSDPRVKNEALNLGYWVEPSSLDCGEWIIHFTWSQDPSNPPNNRALHK